MDPKAPLVKTKRRYDSGRRQEQARRRRDAIIDEAERRFLSEGYGATTISAIAATVDVSVDTVYKTFGGKPGLVRSIRDRALLGQGPVPAEQRSDGLHVRLGNGQQILKAWGALTAEVAPRVAPILLLLRDAAAIDPEVGALLEEMDTDRLRRMTDNARRLRDAGHLRAGMTLNQAADVLWTYSAPELYELLVIRRGWSAARFGRFVADAMISALL
jgi:AcrR family transcriptional regulator